MIETSWLIGSVYVPAQNITINKTDYPLLAGYYYLRHTNPDLSLIDILDGFLSDEGIAGHIVYVAKDRYVRIGCNPGDEFTLVWGLPLAELYGFHGNLPNTENFHEAIAISPLLWSAGKNHTPQESPFKSAGRRVYDTQIGTSPNAIQVADSHHTQIINTYTWSHVAYTRFQTNDDLVPGEFVTFFDMVLRNVNKFFLYAFVQEDLEANTEEVDWPTSGDELGPYGYRNKGLVTWDFQRSQGHQYTGKFNQVTIDCMIVPEWLEP